MIEYRIDYSSKPMKVHNYETTELIGSVETRGLLRKTYEFISPKGYGYKLTSGFFTRKRWKIHLHPEIRIRMKKRKKKLTIEIDNKVYGNGELKRKKIDVKEDELSKVVFSLNWKNIKSKNHVILEDPEYLDINMIFVCSSLLIDLWK